MTEAAAAYKSEEVVRKPFALNLLDIAKSAHAATRALRMTTRGYTNENEWNDLPRHKKDEMVKLARWVVMNDDAGPEGLHQRWVEVGEIIGMKYGAIRQGNEQPNMVHWDNLPEDERAIVILFWSCARSLGAFVAWPE